MPSRKPTTPDKTRKPRKAVSKSVPGTRVGYVALIGRPNAGKSTLLNRILGQKIAITSDKPQTTRLSILGIHTTPRGQIVFIDNPGLHKPLHKLNKRMMNFVYASIETADIICLIIDATQKFGHGDEFALEQLKNVRKPVFLLLNKTDIVRKENILLLIDRYRELRDFKEFIPLSAIRGTNVDVLEKLLFDNLPPAEKLYGDDDVSDQSERFLLAEIIREKILARVEAELPWATAVYIDRIDRDRRLRNREAMDAFADESPDEEAESGLEDAAAEAGKGRDIAVPGVTAGPNMQRREEKPKMSREDRRARPLVYIKASIFVERPNHRKIIVGRQGKNIKEIGIEARREIEDILEAKVFLDLQVKVRPQWRDAADVLDLIEGQKET